MGAESFISVSDTIPSLNLPPYWIGDDEADATTVSLRAAGFQVFEADVTGAEDERALLGAIGEALAYPDYFGANWDAFFDLLADYGVSPGQPTVVMLIGIDRLLTADLHAFVRSVHFLLEATERVAQLSAGTHQLEFVMAGRFSY